MDFEAGRCDVVIHYAKISGKECSRFYRRNVVAEADRVLRNFFVALSMYRT